MQTMRVFSWSVLVVAFLGANSIRAADFEVPASALQRIRKELAAIAPESS